MAEAAAAAAAVFPSGRADYKEDKNAVGNSTVRIADGSVSLIIEQYLRCTLVEALCRVEIRMF